MLATKAIAAKVGPRPDLPCFLWQRSWQLTIVPQWMRNEARVSLYFDMVFNLAYCLCLLKEIHMSMNEPEDSTIYQVVINHEEQYSIWPADREVPAGWQAAGRSGSKQECLDYIEQVWTDMRPLSLRKAMER